MTIEFMGGEMGAMIPSDSDAIEETDAAAGDYNTSFSRCSIRTRGTLCYWESADFLSGALQEIWVHCEYTEASGSGGGSVTVIEVVDNADVPVFRLIAGSNDMQMKRWDGAAFQDIGSVVNVQSDTARQTIDLHIVGNSGTGSATLYIAGTERATGTADMLAVDDMLYVRGYGRSTVSDSAHSQVVVSTTSTIGGRLFTVPVSGAGATSSWTGTYANIDEIVYSDADFINSGTANQVSTFAVTVPTLTGYEVQAVAVTARAKRGSASGPQNLQLALRSAGTDYFSGSKALGLGYGAFVHIWETDPATAAAWVNTAVASLQPGVKSIT